ncbi:RNA polymerase sigma factor [Williamsia sp. DF01-3]|uniref:RNA polymerase sigma factor n=1 Tax=Williamsia sp. DF01-3 TaxID=2934157 RepID=UPI001FF39E17|nr:sigma-70 family RNA polymerase sigma factor [Williamsia sp. DF01-3]MCK0517429.1 sigma-70 family RNA polymerase sigma factor [Williamsia sp. DF01-3]
MYDRTDLALTDAGDDVLRQAARLGDREAFEVLVHRYGPALYRYGVQMLANDADVADAVQETFIAAWRQLDTFRGESSLKTWLFSICSRKIVDTYRLKHAAPINDELLAAVPDTDAARDPFLAAAGGEFLRALDAALTELPVRQRAAWIMHEVEAMTFPEIGAALRLSPDAARGQHHRATSNLKVRLRRWQ